MPARTNASLGVTHQAAPRSLSCPSPPPPQSPPPSGPPPPPPPRKKKRATTGRDTHTREEGRKGGREEISAATGWLTRSTSLQQFPSEQETVLNFAVPQVWCSKHPVLPRYTYLLVTTTTTTTTTACVKENGKSLWNPRFLPHPHPHHSIPWHFPFLGGEWG